MTHQISDFWTADFRNAVMRNRCVDKTILILYYVVFLRQSQQCEIQINTQCRALSKYLNINTLCS